MTMLLRNLSATIPYIRLRVIIMCVETGGLLETECTLTHQISPIFLLTLYRDAGAVGRLGGGGGGGGDSCCIVLKVFPSPNDNPV